MDPRHEYRQLQTRRHFLRQSQLGIGALALSSLLRSESAAATSSDVINPLSPKKPHFAAKAKRCIYLSMIGAPSQYETFDYSSWSALSVSVGDEAAIRKCGGFHDSR